MESQFNSSDTRCMWQGLQTITDYKGKTSHVTDTDVLLPVKLNTFFACFEDSTAPPMRATLEDCGLSFSMADVGKIFKGAKPPKATGPDGIPSRVLRACVEQLASVYRYIQSLPIPVCPHLL